MNYSQDFESQNNLNVAQKHLGKEHFGQNYDDTSLSSVNKFGNDSSWQSDRSYKTILNDIKLQSTQLKLSAIDKLKQNESFNNDFQKLLSYHKIADDNSEIFRKFQDKENFDFQAEIDKLVEIHGDSSLKDSLHFQGAKLNLEAGTRFKGLNILEPAKGYLENSLEYFDRKDSDSLSNFSDLSKENLAEVYEKLDFVDAKLSSLVSIADYYLDKKQEYSKAKEFFTAAIQSKIGNVDIYKVSSKNYINDILDSHDSIMLIMLSISKIMTIDVINSDYLKAYKLSTDIIFLVKLLNHIQQVSKNQLTHYDFMLLMGELCMDMGYFKYRNHKNDEALSYYNKAIEYFQIISCISYIQKARELIDMINYPNQYKA